MGDTLELGLGGWIGRTNLDFVGGPVGLQGLARPLGDAESPEEIHEEVGVSGDELIGR